MLLINEDIYSGELFDCNKEGYGEYNWQIGDQYKDQCKNNISHGKEIIIYLNWDTYVGNWSNGNKECLKKFKC